MTTFAKRITAARKEKKLTQEQVAQAMGVSRQTVSHWENGRVEPTQEQREAVESRISADNDAVEEKVGVARQADEMPAGKKHDAVVLGLLVFGVVVYALSAVGNFFAGAGLIRAILGIHPTEAFPHVPQMLSFLNAVSLGGCALLLLWRRMGVVLLLLGAMIYDVLAVALTDSLPTDTILAAIITATILTVSCNGEKYKDLLR